MKLAKWDLLEVTWEDSYHQSGWRPLYDVPVDDVASLEQQSIGYYIGESNRTLTIAQSAKASKELRSQDDTFVDACLTIPKRAVLKMHKLSPTKNKGGSE